MSLFIYFLDCWTFEKRENTTQEQIEALRMEMQHVGPSSSSHAVRLVAAFPQPKSLRSLLIQQPFSVPEKPNHLPNRQHMLS